MPRKRKTYKRYSPFAFINGLLCFASAALCIVFLFVPVFSFEGGSSLESFTGLDVIYLGIKDFYEVPSRIVDFTSFFQTYLDSGSDNYLYTTIAQIHGFLEMGLALLYVIALFFAVFVGILGIFWIITGRLLLPKSSTVLSWLSTVFFSLTLGAIIAYLFAYSSIIYECGTTVTFNFAFMPILFAVGMLIISIAMSIIHSVAYKNRILYKKPKEEKVVEQKIEEKIEEEKEVEPEKEIEEEIEPEKEESSIVEEETKEEIKEDDSWMCEYCGSSNKGKFCTNCGAPKQTKN